eukprot:365061-Chlamydomonas_euryale.AAC.7
MTSSPTHRVALWDEKLKPGPQLPLLGVMLPATSIDAGIGRQHLASHLRQLTLAPGARTVAVASLNAVGLRYVQLHRCGSSGTQGPRLRGQQSAATAVAAVAAALEVLFCVSRIARSWAAPALLRDAPALRREADSASGGSLAVVSTQPRVETIADIL